jgi:AcrR family transcriptional regulator
MGWIEMGASAQLERQRLLDAMLEELVEKGYPATEVESAARRADLDGEQWSRCFPSKDVCLFAAFEQLTGQLRAAIEVGCASAEDWTSRVAAGLRALLERLAARADLAEALARSFPTIGPAAQARYQGFIESLAPLLAEGRDQATPPLPAEVELLAIGAAEAIVFDQIQTGQAAHLPQIGPEILFSLLVPFLGAQAAEEAMLRERAGAERGDWEPV